MRPFFLFVLACLALLQGCSPSRIAYDNADVYLRWQANYYLDLQGDQSEDLDRGLAALLAWHRARALPQYARLGEEAAARMQRGVRLEDLEWSYDALQAQVREALAAAAAEAAGLLDRLGPEQISHLERRLADDNRKFAKEYLQGDMKERHQRRVRRNVERLEDWFGPLSDAQVERVKRYSARAPFSAGLRERDRKRRQAEFLAMLRAREAKGRFAAWLLAWEADREPAYAEAARATRGEYMRMLVDLDRTLDAGQRAHAVARLRNYAGLFDSLARSP